MAKAKKLKWNVIDKSRGSEACVAHTPLGEFWASNINGTFMVLRRHVWDNDCQDDILSEHPNWPLAKKAAYEHFSNLAQSLFV